MNGNRLLVAGVAAALVLAVVVAVLAWRGRGGGEEAAGPTQVAGETDGWIQLYFTTPQPQGKPSRSGTTGRLDERLVAALGGARQTLDVAIYDLELDNVAGALVAAQGRGVRVRLVTDTDNAKTPAVQKVRAAGIPVVEDGRGAIMHNKFVVLDGEAVWMGSWNFTPSDTFRLNNNAALIRSRELAENYTAEFEKMFVGRRFGPTKPKQVPHPRIEIEGHSVETIFESEGDAPSRIVERIRDARDTITFMAFSFTHDDIGAAIEERYRAGVKVRGVIETTGSDRQDSEMGRFRRAGMDGSQPAGGPRAACAAGPGVVTDGNPYLMHHKVIVIDDRTVIFGSFNFTRNAAQDNDENLLIIDDPALAQQFLDEFCRVYNVGVDKAKNRN